MPRQPGIEERLKTRNFQGSIQLESGAMCEIALTANGTKSVDATFTVGTEFIKVRVQRDNENEDQISRLIQAALKRAKELSTSLDKELRDK